MSINANANVVEAIATVLGGGAGGNRIPRGGSAPLSVEFLIVGGGAAGTVNNPTFGNATYAGGGGGAVDSGSLVLGLASKYTITVGQSGSVSAGYPNVSVGGSSSFSGPAFGGGNYSYAVAGAVGTSGAAPNSNLAGTGDGAGSTLYGGGGGGWTSVGDNAGTPNPAGQGGYGTSWFINGVAALSVGGGGGGGMVDLAGAGGAFGRDGGGRGGGQTNFSSPGTRGSGGGGGAAGNNNSRPASPGGCGSIVIAYPTPSSTESGISYGVGGEITTATYGGVEYTIHTFYEDGTFETFVR